MRRRSAVYVHDPFKGLDLSGTISGGGRESEPIL